MGERRQGLLVTLLVVAALAGLYWAVQLLPWRFEEVDHGFGEAARRDPFLAAQLFLKQHDVPVTAERGLSRLNDLPAPGGATLLIYSSEGVLSQAQTERLWQWVEQGGHLIINANTFSERSDGESLNPLFNRLGLGVDPIATDEEPNSDERVIRSTALLFNQRQGECLDEEHLTEIEFEGETTPLKIDLRSNIVLENGGELESVAAVNNDGAQLLRYFVGNGMVTLVTDMSLWSNRYIACYDHAYLLWKMIGDGEVLILSHTDMPSLFALLWQKAALGVILSLLLLAAWLWRRSRRFGPLLAQDHTQRRSLAEHLHASAMFLWRNGALHESIDGLRQSIRARMIVRHPGYKQLTRDEQHQLIALITSIDPAEVHRAMTQPKITKPQQLTELVQRLQQIRNQL